MPESRNRPGHPHQKESAVPASQRVRGRIIWAVLFAVFAGLIALFAAGQNFIVLAIAIIGGAAIGYTVGKTMEKDAGKKD